MTQTIGLFLFSIGVLGVAVILYKTAIINYVDDEMKEKDLANRKVHTYYPDEQPELNDWFKIIHNKN